LARWLTDFLWYRDVQHTDVYWTMFWGRWLLGGAVAAGFFLIVFVNIFLALRRTPNTLWLNFGQQLRERSIGLLDRVLRRIVYWGAGLLTGLFALGIGRSAADFWPQFLLFAQGQPVGTQDPIFQHDIGYYLFRLPVWELLNRWLFFSLILALIFTTIIYLLTHGIRKLHGATIATLPARVHLSILLALTFLVKARGYYLNHFGILYRDNGLFIGAGYADVHATLPGLRFMMVLAIIAAAVSVVSILSRNIKLLAWYVVGLLVASILVLGIYPSLVQRFAVKPNERVREQPFIQHHITQTRKAYGLDTIQEASFAPTPKITPAAIQASPGTLNNVRLWDHDTLLQIYRQRQEIRTYYQINNVDIDRYRLNGQLRQVMLAAREIDTTQLPSQTWVNRHLIYTHGYGVVMSPVNTFDQTNGEPHYLLKDVPPTAAYPELALTRPEIYFGESQQDYAIVCSSEDEFDYQLGDSETKTTRYSAAAGIPLRNGLVRAMLAWRLGSLDLLISSQITGESRLLLRRQIIERAQAVAPFLAFDRDPYIVIGNDGRLYWMLDAYTRSIRYPYAQYTELEIAGGEAVRSNYVRNPVKMVIDAYDGSTRCYIIDEQEPFIRAWRNVFPHLFSPIADMPAGLAQHVRMPEGQFNTVSEIYRKYHMQQADAFYRQVDLWEIPANPSQSETLSGMRRATLPAYYTIMSQPGQHEPEYLLIRPYTPSGKPNMIAWLSARSDPERFGEMQVYAFPAQSSIDAPGQIFASMNAKPDISRELSLWQQRGSEVIFGNLLVIPMADSILYVQPIYLKAERAPIPALQRVIVADQQHIIMRPSLESALAELSGLPLTVSDGNTGGFTLPTPTPTPPPVALTAEQRALARAALEHYERAQSALARQPQDWATYGKEMESMRKKLEEMVQ